VFSTLNSASKTVDQLNKQLDIDQLEEIKDRLEEQQADMQEKADFFINAGKMDDEEDLMDELNELEAINAEEELAGLEIGANPIKAPQPGAAGKVGPSKGKSEADELRELEQMMAL
jgi:Snf7